MKSIILILGIIFVLFFSCKKDNPGPNEVFMDNSKFSPSSITISAGTTVTWTNQESVVHTVTSDNNTFSSGDLGKKKTFSYTFSTTGTFPYHCIHHSGMTGTVIVQ